MPPKKQTYAEMIQEADAAWGAREERIQRYLASNSERLGKAIQTALAGLVENGVMENLQVRSEVNYTGDFEVTFSGKLGETP